MKIRALAVVVSALLLSSHASQVARAASAQNADEAIRTMLLRLEQAVRSGDPNAYLALLGSTAGRPRAIEFAASEIRPGATRVVLKERSRAPAADASPGTGYRVVVDAFVEFSNRGRIATWHLDLRSTTDNSWVIVNEARLSAVNGLYRLSINSARQFSARDFTVAAEDFDLSLANGSVFTVETDRGVTALVLLGQGTMRFHPASTVEKGQVRIYAGAETLTTPFEAAFVRVGHLASHADLSRLVARDVDPRELRRAEDVLAVESPKTFAFDLGDLAPGSWSTLPGVDEVVAEVRTKKFGTLTYSRSEEADEDISLFDRAKQKNISVYASQARFAERGRFYDEDAAAVYDIVDYDLGLAFAPDRRWFDARARLRIRIRAASATQLTLRLADTLAVESVSSDEYGALFSIRVRDQNTLLVNLPVALRQDEELTIMVVYSGRVAGQPIEWETLPFTQRDLDMLNASPEAPTQTPREPIYIYGNRSYWYPRAPIFDYATATLRIWVPADFDCVASGELAPDSPTLDDVDPARRRKLYVFTATRPLRYLSFFVTRLAPVERATVAFSDDPDATGRFSGPAMGGAVYNTLNLTVQAHAGAMSKAQPLMNDAVAMMQFFRSMVGDSPYSSLTLAVVEGNTPGGHSPGHIAAIRLQAENAPRPWRNDPATVDEYPELFQAHVIAHQWWGQAVGWKTYHDQWLSEGFAQYFAALYVRERRGDEAFHVVMRQMRKWAIEQSSQGPIFLGYRIGHVRDDGRAYRAVVYNKGAAVLHMLRRLIGDEAFFPGVRRFYANWRFQKAGTEDLRRAMESESGQSLERFFERWVYGSTLPQLTFSYRVQAAAGGTGRDVLLRIDQAGELFDVPVTVVLQYAGQPSVEVVVPVTDRTVEVRIPLSGTLRRVDVSMDDGTVAEVKKG